MWFALPCATPSSAFFAPWQSLPSPLVSLALSTYRHETCNASCLPLTSTCRGGRYGFWPRIAGDTLRPFSAPSHNNVRRPYPAALAPNRLRPHSRVRALTPDKPSQPQPHPLGKYLRNPVFHILRLSSRLQICMPTHPVRLAGERATNAPFGLTEPLTMPDCFSQ